MDRRLPGTVSEWKQMAEEEGILDMTIHELQKIPSASKMELCVALLLRTLWTPHIAKDFSMSELGINKTHEELAKNFFLQNKFYQPYLNDIATYRRSRPKGIPMPELGCFTLARYYQLEIQPNDTEESATYEISPLKTRSKTFASRVGQGTTGDQQSHSTALDRRQLEKDLPESSTPPRSLSSSNPSSIDSPLAGRGKKPSPHGEASTHDELSHERLTDDEYQSISSHSAAHASAVPTLYPQTEDEQIVNIALILFANSLTVQCRDAKAQWTPIRKVLQTRLENASFEARTDGFLRGCEGSIEAIVEVKPRLRAVKLQATQIQETAQMVSWIIMDEFGDKPEKRRLVKLYTR